MHITFGFIYYFVILMTTLTVALFITKIPKVRIFMLKVSRMFGIAENHIVLSVVYFSFILLLAVFIDTACSFFNYVNSADFGTYPIT